MTEAGAGAFWNIHSVSGVKGMPGLPGDKSISHRAAILGALADGVTRLDGWLAAADCLATLGILKRLGVGVKPLNDGLTSLEITGVGLGGLKSPETDAQAPVRLDCGNSGTTMRVMLGVLAGHPFRAVLGGDESLSRRPMKRVVEPLRSMGARIDGPEDGAHAPLEVEGGTLAGGDYEIKTPSAQVKTALLLAGLHARGITRVKEPAKCRDHTERALKRLGAKYWMDEEGWHCVEGGVRFQGGPQRIPADMSAAAFFMVAAAITARSEVELQGVGVNPGRTGIIEVLEKMGARITVTNEREIDGEPVADIIVKGGAPLRAVRIAGDLIPRVIDEVPAIAVAACFAEGVTVIKDAAELRAKESDRIASVTGELSRMGAKIGMLADGMAIEGPVALKGAKVMSQGDHRIAMALAVAGLAARGDTVVEDTGNVGTSYPTFYADLMEMCR